MKKTNIFSSLALFFTIFLNSLPDPAMDVHLVDISKMLSVGLEAFPSDFSLKRSNDEEYVLLHDLRKSRVWHFKNLNLLANVAVGSKKKGHPEKIKNILFLRIDFILCKESEIATVPFEVPICFLSGWEVPSKRKIIFRPPEVKLLWQSEEADLMLNFPDGLRAETNALDEPEASHFDEADYLSDVEPQSSSAYNTGLHINMEAYLKNLLMDVRHCSRFPDQKILNNSKNKEFETHREGVMNEYIQALASNENKQFYEDKKDFFLDVGVAIEDSKSVDGLRFRILESEQGAFACLFNEVSLQKLLEKKQIFEEINSLKNQGYKIQGIIKHVSSWYHTCLHCNLFYGLYLRSRRLEGILEKIFNEKDRFSLSTNIFISSLVKIDGEVKGGLFYDCCEGISRESSPKGILSPVNGKNIYKHKKDFEHAFLSISCPFVPF